MRDTRILVRAVWRLLTDTVLPLDFPAHARALKDELRRIDASLGGGLSLDPVFSAADALEIVAARATSDAALMALSRVPVPADYTSGDRFAHDPALPIALARLGPGSRPCSSP